VDYRSKKIIQESPDLLIQMMMMILNVNFF
jgi:hypothetical protein